MEEKSAWENESSGELQTLISGISNHYCSIYLADDKVLAFDHLYEICMKNIEDIQLSDVEKMNDFSHGCILFTRNGSIRFMSCYVQKCMDEECFHFIPQSEY